MKKAIFIILIMFSLIPAFSTAQEYKLLEPLPCIEGTGNNCKGGEVIKKINLDTYIGYVFKFSIALAAFLAVIMIIWGGVEYMGSEVPFIKSNGKQRIWNAITGLLMVLASYLILATIDPRLVEINTKIEAIKIDPKDLEAVKAFQNQLASDIKTLGAEARNKSLDLENQIKEKQKQIDELNTKADDRGGEPLTDEETIELRKLEDERKTLQAEQAKIIATGIMRNEYLVAIGIDSDRSKDNTQSIRQAAFDRAEKAINNSFEKYGKILEEAGDIEGYQNLLLRKSFYDRQMSDNSFLMSKITSYENSDSKSNRENLISLACTYQKELDSTNVTPTDGLRRDPELEAEYKKIIQDRIALINKTLQKQ